MTATGNVCWVDVESTGLHPDLHHIWEVGLIMPDDTEHHWFLPADLANADPFALEIGGYHQRHPTGYDKSYDHSWAVVTYPASFAAEFARLTKGLHLAGAVVSFDAERLARLLRANGQMPAWHYHIIDVEALAIGWLQGQARGYRATGHGDMVNGDMVLAPPWDSKKLTAALGIDLDQFTAHEALSDARWARAIYRAVMG